MTPGGEIGDDVLKRVEGGPVEREGGREGERGREGGREGGRVECREGRREGERTRWREAEGRVRERNDVCVWVCVRVWCVCV